MLINLSNHPAEKWQGNQISLAKEKYGSVQDLPFPQVPPAATKNEVVNLSESLFKQICDILDERANNSKPNAVHVQGEFTLVFSLVTMLKESDIVCIASTSNRNVKQEGNKKIISFEFIQFREY